MWRRHIRSFTGDCPDPRTAIFSNVREHICNSRLRLSPLNLRLSPGDRGRIATLRKMQSPVAFQRRLARPRCNVPYFEGVVPGCRDDSLAVGRPIDRRDSITAIFLMSGNTYVTVVYASPPLNLRLSPPDRAKTKMRHLWPFRRKIFAPVCAQMRWMHPRKSPVPMMSPAGPYCRLQIVASKRAVSHPLDPW